MEPLKPTCPTKGSVPVPLKKSPLPNNVTVSFVRLKPPTVALGKEALKAEERRAGIERLKPTCPTKGSVPVPLKKSPPPNHVTVSFVRLKPPTLTLAKAPLNA